MRETPLRDDRMGLSQLAPGFGILGLLMALGLYRYVVAQPAVGGAMLEIADAIHTGAMVFKPTPRAAWRSPRLRPSRR